MGLFTEGKDNHKLAKSNGTRYFPIGLFLSPFTYNSSGVNICPFASSYCAEDCLNTSGFAGFYPKILEARRRKTDRLLADRQKFYTDLIIEIQRLKEKAERMKKTLVVRLNGTSDIDFPSRIFDAFPKTQFWDYTKNPHRMSKYLCGNLPSNYHLTFSYSGVNLVECMNVLKAGGNVATVFSSGEFPALWRGYKVVSGENSDLRFLDKRNVVVGLKAKGKAKKHVSPFVIQIEKRSI